MDIVAGLKNWISFKSMITPIILKVLYQLGFILLNVIGLLFIFGISLAMIIGGFTGNNTSPGMAIITAVLFFIIGLILLILSNLFMRMYFELVLLLFNIYDELKIINTNTKK